MIKNEIQLSYLSDISIYLSYFYFLYINDFLMVNNQVYFGFCHQLHLNCQEPEARNKKNNFVIFFFIFKFLNLSEI